MKSSHLTCIAILTAVLSLCGDGKDGTAFLTSMLF